MNLIPKNPVRRTWLGLGAAFLLPTVFAIWTVLVETIPARDLTATRMFVTKRRIIEYAREHEKLPSSLAVLPPMPSNEDSATTDAWGRPLDYSFDSSGVVTLRSLGADKVEGGDGDNRDMIGVFPTRDGEGGWQDPVSQWTKDPQKP